MSNDLRTLIFIPTYNESENIEALFDCIRRTRVDADFLLLDDNSPDGTGQIIDRLAAENPGVHTIHRPGKLGVGSAHRDGIRWAYQHGYQLLVTLDSDFTHAPEMIPEFLSNAADSDVLWDPDICVRAAWRAGIYFAGCSRISATFLQKCCCECRMMQRARFGCTGSTAFQAGYSISFIHAPILFSSKACIFFL